jgi:hypothetical protein
MEEILICPGCHQPVAPIDYFCPNCGKNLRPSPLSTSPASQILLYLKTIILPPFGFYWGYRYLRQSDTTSKIVGLITILITLVEIIWLTQTTIAAVNTVNQQVQIQLNGL